jgi:putative ABC transport system permease protein
MVVVEGREFSREHSTDEEEAFILNETAVKELGWESAINKKIVIDDVASGEARKGRVIGVVRDSHLRSLHHTVEPLVLMVAPEFYYLDNLVVRISPRDISNTLAGLAKKWSEFVPNRPIEYSFLNEEFGRLYRTEQRLGKSFTYFSGFAVLVGCLGLFALASFTAEQRTKEVGIRKVLGASVSGIVGLMSKDFVRLVLIANIIAWPVAYLAINDWLRGFAYRIHLGIGMFILAGPLTLLIALFTVSTQAIKAALANPVESLRYE